MMGDTANMLGPRTGWEVGRALAGDLTHGRTQALYRRSRARALRDDGALRALRREPEDGLQVARSVRGGRALRAQQSEPRTAPLSAPDRAGGGAGDRGRASRAPVVGAAEAARLAGPAASGARPPRDQHGGRSLGAPRTREEASPTPPSHASGSGARGHARA